jgi:ElaB/YqjD/DUF883 family membrane-anchored ribosome-binding protein
MFNTNKENDLKDKATHLAETTKNNMEKTASDVKRGAEDMATNVKRSAEDIGQNLQNSATQSKNEALGVVNSLKNLLAQYASSTNVNALKEQILDKAYELKGTVTDEVAHAYQVSKDRTVHTVQEKPLVSLGLAIGAGLLLGYILGSKNTSKE